MKTILVPYDGSVQARRALERAADLAQALPARLVVTGATGATAPAGPAERFERTIALLRDRALDIELAAPAGSPEAILEVAERHGADVIAVGDRDRGRLARLLGATDEQSASGARCDILVVH